MKYLNVALAVFGLALSLAGCDKSADEPDANPLLAEPVPAGMIRGEVLETMDASGYTYVLLDLDTEQRWVAGPQTSVSIGDVIQTGEGMEMGQFTSESLGRTFENLYFVGVFGNLSSPEMPAGHPTIPAQAANDAAAVSDIAVEAAEAGQDIAWVYANKESLAGQAITLRGKVVKYNANILGSNFLHIQDGSGKTADGSNDLIVTTQAEAAVGQTVLVSGNVVLDKDYGAGYRYPVLVEDATVTAE